MALHAPLNEDGADPKDFAAETAAPSSASKSQMRQRRLAAARDPPRRAARSLASGDQKKDAARMRLWSARCHPFAALPWPSSDRGRMFESAGFTRGRAAEAVDVIGERQSGLEGADRRMQARKRESGIAHSTLRNPTSLPMTRSTTLSPN